MLRLLAFTNLVHVRGRRPWAAPPCRPRSPIDRPMPVNPALQEGSSELETFLVDYLVRWNGQTHRALVFALLANVHPRPLEGARIVRSQVFF